MFCPRCGNKIDDGSTTCSYCGAQFILLDPQGAGDAQQAVRQQSQSEQPTREQPTREQPTQQQPQREQSTQQDAIDVEQMWLPQSPDGYYQAAAPAQPMGTYQPADTSQQDTMQRPTVVQQPDYQQPLYSQPYEGLAEQQPPKKNQIPIILGIAAALILLFSAIAYAVANWLDFAPGGFGAKAVVSDEDTIRQQVEMAISAATELSEADIEELIGSEESALLEAYGIDLPALVKRMMGYLSYEVGEVTIDGDSAVARVSLSFPDFGELQDKFVTHVLAELSSEDFAELISGDTSVLYGKIVDMLFETIDKYPSVRVSSTSDIGLSRQSDGSWELSEEDLNDLWGTLFEDVSSDIGDYTSVV